MAPKKEIKTQKKRRMPTEDMINSVDVIKTKQIPKLSDILRNNKFTIVLIWANFCGHCHTFKEQIWNKLLANKNRKAGLASIHYDQLDTTPPEIPKKVPNGYPTVLFIGKDKKPMKFKGSIEYPHSRNITKMTEIAESDEPESLLSTDLNDTPRLSSEAESLKKAVSPKDVLNTLQAKEDPHIKVSVPNYKSDMLNSQERVGEKNRMKGGNLYRTLLNILQFDQTRSSKSKRTHQTRRTSR